MDSLFKAYNANASAKINVKEYFEQYLRLLETGESEINAKAGISVTPFTQEQLDELSVSCSIDLLNICDFYVPSENRVLANFKTKQGPIKVDIGLQTLLKVREKYSEYSPQLFRPSLKYQSETPVIHNLPIESGSKAIPGKDMLIYVRVYRPFKCPSGEIPRRKQKIAVGQVMEMLGQHTLADLRDKISCLSDGLVISESSKNPDNYNSISNKEIYKSSFFFIENTFYIDTRHPLCHDNSEVIREWATHPSRNYGPYNTAKMEDTRFDSFTVSFGYPWLFQHQGDCEHLIVFSDARFVNVADQLAIANYPRVHRTKLTKYSNCMMCNDYSVHWIVCESDRIPHDRCYFCNKCFKSYNYKNGVKIGSFKAYRYPMDPDLLNWINAQKETEGD